MMNVLLVGAGAREHAIAWKLRQSRKLGALYAAPGNAGVSDIADTLPLPIPKPGAPQPEVAAFLDGASRLAQQCRADLVVVASDDPLAFGLVDRLATDGFAVCGPTEAAAEIESSKAFAKGLMQRHGIPMGAVAAFDNYGDARRYVETHNCDVVVKADGPALGKGTIVPGSRDEALDALRELMLDGALGPSGRRVVIEDRLIGPEVSAMAFTDGRTVAHMPFSCDHKAVFDGNRGPNTGGMGAYSPPSWLRRDVADAIRRDVTEAAVRAMAAEGRLFAGVLFPGLILTADGARVIEFNARFGDPECEVLLPKLQTDLLDVFTAIASGTLDKVDVRWSDDVAITVMLASGGYPGAYETGKPITGLENVDPDVIVFHAGTKRDDRGRIETAGGRVLAVTATAPTFAAAREKAYANIARIHFDGMHYRTDIGASEASPAPLVGNGVGR
jgi:phosphoribosylamine--glycine ligase